MEQFPLPLASEGWVALRVELCVGAGVAFGSRVRRGERAAPPPAPSLARRAAAHFERCPLMRSNGPCLQCSHHCRPSCSSCVR